jgi:hypothetical protein
MCIIIEILNYLMRQILDFCETLSEDESYENFKSLLLLHAMHRPPHSLAILTLEEVKKLIYMLRTHFSDILICKNSV